MTFAAGQAQLTDSHRDYLAKLAGMMRDRPQLAIKVCGVAVQADKTFYMDLDQQKKKDTKQAPDSAAADYTPQLTALAGQRADAVKDYLVNEHQTQASRLVECQPRVVTDKAEAKPRTDLLI